MIKDNKRWFIQGTIGILLTGSGLCMVVESAFYKHISPDSYFWIFAGTGSLIIFMAGLILMIDSIRYKK